MNICDLCRGETRNRPRKRDNWWLICTECREELDRISRMTPEERKAEEEAIADYTAEHDREMANG